MKPLILPHDHGNVESAEFIQKDIENSIRFDTAAEIFRQLSDPTRLKIFWILCHYEECVINISAMLGMSSPAVSHHLRALKESGLIESRRNGKEVYYFAADTESCKMLHEAAEQVLELACPELKGESGDLLSPGGSIREVHDYLVGHLDEKITIEELAKKFLINPTTLKDGFKSLYGMSIAAHVKEHRMKKAAFLLKETNASIGETARAVGYESQSKFSAAFKEEFGMLPLEYRRVHTP